MPDFSKWWSENGKEDRILLLPKLSDSWLYEQYRWGYLSLFPLLKNFGNTGIVENTDLLSSNEYKLLDRLYGAINNSNFSEQELLTSILGIRYFLVRNDFYYDLANQETNNPKEIEDKLKQNPKIDKARKTPATPNEPFNVKLNAFCFLISSSKFVIFLSGFPTWTSRRSSLFLE